MGPDTWNTWQAAKKLSVSWKLPTNVSLLNDTQFINDGKALLTGGTPYVAVGTNGPGTVYTVEGDATAASTAVAGAAKQVSATYTLPYVPHATNIALFRHILAHGAKFRRFLRLESTDYSHMGHYAQHGEPLPETPLEELCAMVESDRKAIALYLKSLKPLPKAQ